MKLKKAESEMLPVWVLSGVYTKPFFAWLNEAEKSNIWEHQNDTVVKMRQGNFIYLYLQKGAGKNLVPGHDLKFAGLFVRKNYNLYDVDMELAVLLGLPEEIGFPCRTDIRRAAEERASQKADEILEMHWQEFLFQSGLDTKSLIPLVVRSEIRERAENYYLQGRNLADIKFEPKISLETSFSDTMYLLFLEYGEQVVEKIAKRWIKRNIAYISQQRILFGCVRDEFREILNTPNDRIHKIKRLIQALEGNNSRTVKIVLCRNGKVIHTNVRAVDICNPKGCYAVKSLVPKDRGALYRVFGKAAEFRIEDIQSVSCGRELLYEDTKKKTA